MDQLIIAFVELTTGFVVRRHPYDAMAVVALRVCFANGFAGSGGVLGGHSFSNIFLI